MAPDRLLGTSPTRTDGAAKVTGQARYVDDLPFEGALHGKTIRTTVARGRLRGIRYLPGVPWDEFVIVTAQDIPGANVVTLIDTDQPYLVHDQVRHAAEPVVLIAHADKGLVEKAARLVELDITPEPGVFTLDDSLKAGARGDAQYGANNVFKHFHVARGDAQAALAMIEALLGSDPRNVPALVARAQALVALGRDDQARRSLGSAYAAAPADLALLEAYADLLEAGGQLSTAQALRRQASSLRARAACSHPTR